jgi:hypothetical protein
MKDSKLGASVFIFVLVALIMYPVKENWSAKPVDDFPFSYYPMFAKKRGKTYKIYHAVGYNAKGERHFIPYKMLGTGGFNQVRRQVSKRCKSKSGSAKLVARVARRLGKNPGLFDEPMVRVDLVKCTYDLDAFFVQKQHRPLKEKVIVTASVIPEKQEP